MDKFQLDCRGLACPQPVVETKRKLETMAVGTLDVLVDNETAKNNVLKLAASLGLEVAAREDAGIYTITLLKEDASLNRQNNNSEQNLLITSETFGSGDAELGQILIKSFFYALAESDRLPKGLYLLNGGVKLACADSQVIDSLQRLASLGVGIHSCGLCLDYFGLKEKLAVGDITNMYTIVEQISSGTITRL